MWRYCLVVVLFCMALFLDPEGATRERCRGTTFNCVVNRKVVHWCVLKKKHNTEICRKCSVQFMLKEACLYQNVKGGFSTQSRKLLSTERLLFSLKYSWQEGKSALELQLWCSLSFFKLQTRLQNCRTS